MTEKIRPIAIAIIRRDRDIFVFEAHDPVKKQTYYRPLGGGIEFGEYSQDTLVREIREELETEIVNLRYLAALENIFTVNGRRGHEIVMVYQADFADPSFYQCAEVRFKDGGPEMLALWKSLDSFHPQRAPLYPDGLPELLAELDGPGSG